MMTIEERRAAIEAYCDTMKSCDSCPLQSITEGRNCYSRSEDPLKDADVERNYQIINGYLVERDNPRSGIMPPIRLDTLLRNPARVTLKEDADAQDMKGIDIALNVDTSGLDAAIGKASRLVELLESANDLLSRITQRT